MSRSSCAPVGAQATDGVLSLGSKNKIVIYFVFRSLNRIFAVEKQEKGYVK